jgi:hypothetical protein
MINKAKKSERFSSEPTLTIASINGAKQTLATYSVAVERYKIRSISCHAKTAPTNAPSRIYGLQIKKELT